jgi:hypothetical protein
VWRDAPDAETEPNHLTTASLTVTSADTLPVHFAVDGGFVAELVPTDK